MKPLFFLICLLGTMPLLNAQDDTAQKYAQTITADDLYQHVAILASDSLEGRNTGEKGQKMAADYIKSQFSADGLQAPVEAGSQDKYYQAFTLERVGPGEAYLNINGKKIEHLSGFGFYGNADMEEEATAQAIFVGKGSEKDYEGLDVRDKAVILYAPDRAERVKQVDLAKEKGANKFFVIGAENVEKFDNYLTNYEGFFTRTRMGFPQEQEQNISFLISPEIASEALNTPWPELESAMQKNEEAPKNVYTQIEPALITYMVTKEKEEVKTENVLGYIEGQDKKDELIIITAHYDHVGVEDGKIYNGANDDASGTAAVMELAQAFAHAKEDGNGPDRSILFMAVTAEEKGLLGSLYYSENPVFPLKNTVANLNIDMIGRIDSAHTDNPEYVYVIGSGNLSTELKAISENANSTYTDLALDYRFDGDDPNRYYYRSDHYNFAKNNIPIIFYFNGVHEDYHRPTDTIEKLDFDAMEHITKLVFFTAWELVNRGDRIKVDVKADAGQAKP